MTYSAKDLEFDFKTCFGRGRITRKQWQDNMPESKKSFKSFVEKADTGQLGFFKLPNLYKSGEELKPIEKAAKRAIKDFDNLVLIGIGGSALGPRMLFNALANKYHNELPKTKSKGVKLYFLENNDPNSFNTLMNHVNLSKTLFNVVSKSGSTVETACQFSLVLDLLKKKFPKDWQKRLVFTTDPSSGKLREMADKHNIECLDIPTDTGGRYSVLSPVGLFPAMAVGIDVKPLLAGAERMADRCLDTNIPDNPSLYASFVHYLGDVLLKKNMIVAFPYADQLRDWTEWFCQLWAESIGKEKITGTKTENFGTTPIKTLGTIDQHSQMQLYMEGPNDKVYMFIKSEKFNDPAKFPAKSRLPKAFDYLAGHSMEELINAELKASRFALGKNRRMTYQVNMPEVNAHTLGQLIMWAEAMTVMAGFLYGVNPFNQPGVEIGKKYAYGLMGRKGFEKFRDKIEGK